MPAADYPHDKYMTDELMLDVRLHGDLTRISTLRTKGHSQQAIRSAIARGTLIAVARDWVATESARQVAVIAVVNGGKLTGPTALATQGVWDALDRRIHIAHRPNSHRSRVESRIPISRFVAPRFAFSGVVRHWNRALAIDLSQPPWRTSMLDALVVTARVARSEQFIASLDSAISHGLFSRAGLPALAAALPERLRYCTDLADGRAESGLETIARLGLAPIVHTIEVQFRIPGLSRWGGEGRVDLLLDGWLVIELDGDEFHDPASDRDRNAFLVRNGYRIHRFGFEQIMFDWPNVEATVRELLRYPSAR